MRVQLPKIAVLLHLVLLVVYLSWARAGAFRLDVYLPLVWLVPGLLEMVLLFPPMRRNETPEEARVRARRQIGRDPLFYIGLALLLFIALQSLNGPRLPRFDSVLGEWRLTPAPWPGLPFCLHRGEALQGLFWFGTAWAGALAVRHGLSRRAKTLLLELLVMAAALLAAFGLLQYGAGARALYWVLPMQGRFFATFSYPNHAGAFFTMMFFVAGGLLIAARAEEDAAQWRLWSLALALLLNLLGATFTLAYGALLLVWGGLLLGTIYACAFLLPLLQGSTRLRFLAALTLTAGALAFLHFVAYPENAVHRRTGALLSGSWRAGGWQEERAVLRSAAVQVWRHNPCFGVGIWGFRHQAGLYLTDDDWSIMRTQAPQTCHNDYLQFLCELGLLGAGLLLAAIIVLLLPVAARLREDWSVRAEAGVARIPWLQRMPPAAVGAICGATSVALLAGRDLPFRNPLILLVWCLLLAALPGLLPKPRTERPVAGRASGRADASRSAPGRR